MREKTRDEVQFQDFCDKILRVVTANVPNVQVEKIQMQKTNRVLTGLCFKEKDKTAKHMEATIDSTIYLDSYYDQFLSNGMDVLELAEIALEIVEIFKESQKEKKQAVEAIDNILSDYERAKPYIKTKMINKELNADLLCGLPYRIYLDLAVICHVSMCVDNYYRSVTVSNALLKLWGVTMEQVFSDALENLKNAEPIMIDTLNYFIANQAGTTVCNELEEDHPLNPMSFYVVRAKTEDELPYGFSYILNKDLLKGIAAKINDDFYIIPTSVYEMGIIMGQTVLSSEAIRDMVTSINSNPEIISDDAYLSDNIYLYQINDGSITIIQ